MAHSHEDHHHERPRDLTRNQGLVLEALNRADGPLSAYDILDRLREDGLRAPLQIYRALDKLIEQGLAHRLESLNAFVCCADAGCHRVSMAAFAICSGCGRVDEFTDPEVTGRLVAWSERTGFALERTTIELRGRCAQCGKPAS
ncbi:MAG: transcriptional repressor [Devosia sp.]|uniref:Fur family transcriptional regulator n=1 Tax=Devosia sp. TaxID=1871048 RepID=UPI001AD0F96A|nr:Fur family transcriptional regulator [Devosia sp.]MBN9314835.1 transcriptional repressor [Devosia sp.]